MAPGSKAFVLPRRLSFRAGRGFPDESDGNWRYWPADVHIIGKDIIRFHAVYWPAFLMSAGIPVPKRVYAHGFLFNRGEKMSKSVGNVVDPFNLADQYGVDQMRYFFLREVPFGQDGNYNHEAIVARINADLANDLGNLAQRSLSMIAKQLSGVLPEPGEFSDNDKAMLSQADGMVSAARDAMATQQIHQWLNAVWAVVAEAKLVTTLATRAAQGLPFSIFRRGTPGRQPGEDRPERQLPQHVQRCPGPGSREAPADPGGRTAQGPSRNLDVEPGQRA